jgi:hypothetical protein
MPMSVDAVPALEAELASTRRLIFLLPFFLGFVLLFIICMTFPSIIMTTATPPITPSAYTSPFICPTSTMSPSTTCSRRASG